jgi:hypothetical protein
MWHIIHLFALLAVMATSVPDVRAEGPAPQTYRPCTEDTPLPALVHLLPIGPDAPADAVALLPGWEGTWDGMPSRMIIEAVDGDAVLVVYAWGARNDPQRGWSRFWATIQAGTLEFTASDDVRFSFTRGEGQHTLNGRRITPQGVTTSTMTRCQP